MNYRINRLHGSETIVIGAQQYTRKDGKGKADVFACSTSGRLLPTGRKNAIKHDHKSKNPTTRWSDMEPCVRSNLSKTKIIPPKTLIFSDICCTFAMSLMILLVLICSTKVSVKSDMEEVGGTGTWAKQAIAGRFSSIVDNKKEGSHHCEPLRHKPTFKLLLLTKTNNQLTNNQCMKLKTNVVLMVQR